MQAPDFLALLGLVRVCRRAAYKSVVAAISYVLFDAKFRETQHSALRDREGQPTMASVEPVGLYAEFLGGFIDIDEAIAALGCGAVASFGRESEFAAVERVQGGQRCGR